MNRINLITQYCALFEHLYGELPAADLSKFSYEEIQEAVDQLNELNERTSKIL